MLNQYNLAFPFCYRHPNQASITRGHQWVVETCVVVVLWPGLSVSFTIQKESQRREHTLGKVKKQKLCLFSFLSGRGVKCVLCEWSCVKECLCCFVLLNQCASREDTFFLRVEFLLKTDSGYPRDAEVTLFTLVNPGSSLRFSTHWSAPPVSTVARSALGRCPSHLTFSDNDNARVLSEEEWRGRLEIMLKARGLALAALTYQWVFLLLPAARGRVPSPRKRRISNSSRFLVYKKSCGVD